jgi:hypothetical protein
VNQIFESGVLEVPTACLPALAHCASLPGAFGASVWACEAKKKKI